MAIGAVIWFLLIAAAVLAIPLLIAQNRNIMDDTGGVQRRANLCGRARA
tara:strand:- start:441 stop:587 length:147 start_codon:yes stop_codon:yes gene_type:complete